MIRAGYPWYKVSIGHRLKPRIRKVYETWAGFTDNELIPHLHRIVSSSAQSAPLQLSSAYLNGLFSERKHGYMVHTLVSDSGTFFCRVSQAFLSIPKS